MSTYETSLIKVKAMTKNMAKQIKVCHLMTSPGREILEDLRNDYVRPIAWASGQLLDGYPDNQVVWLIEWKGNWHWLEAPYGGKSNIEWMQNCTKNLPQIFIG